MKPVCIVQARMTSTRLPGKVLLDLGGKPVLRHVLDRCKEIYGIEEVVCTVPNDPASEPMLSVISDAGAKVVFGPEDDVLWRYVIAAAHVEADPIMRITADCPLISPSVCSRVLSLYSATNVSYASNTHPRNFPRGMDCEVFSRGALDRANEMATDPYDREHVCPWMVRNLNLANLGGPGDNENYCIDTPEDYERLKRLFQ